MVEALACASAAAFLPSGFFGLTLKARISHT
jgi:hypothetical protein